MAGPITWRNVNAPSNAEAALMFRGASTQLNAGLSDFSNIIKNAEATQANNVRATDEVGKQNYLDLLQTAKTPEELAALQADPATAAARANLSAAARNATRGSEDARLTSLRANVNAETAYNNQQLDEAEKPIRDEINTVALTDPIRARAMAVEAQQSGKLRQVAPLIEKAQATERDNTRYAQSQTTYNQQQETYNHDLANRPMRDNALQRADETGRLQAEQQARDETDRTAVEKAVAPRLQAFDAQKTDFNNKVKAIGASLGLTPESGTGLPDTDKMSPDQLKQFGLALKAQGLDRAATSSEYLDGMRKEMVANGASVKAITAALNQATPVITGDTPLSPEDKALKDSMVGAIDAQLDKVKANNLFYNPPKETNQMRIDVLHKADTLITGDGAGTKARLRDQMTEWLDKGIAIRGADGKRVMVQVPPKVLDYALTGGLEADSTVWNSTAGNMRDIIQRVMTSPEFQQQRDEAVPFNNGDYLVKQRNINRDFKRLNGTVTPSDYLVSFDKRLAAEIEKTQAAQKTK